MSLNDEIKIKRVLVTDCEHVEGKKHSCEYVDWRDGLVLVAEASADAKYGAEPRLGASRDEKAAWAMKWDAFFHREMRRLTSDPFVRARAGRDAFGGQPERYRDADGELEMYS